jgi:hypothetical protein
MIGSNDEPAKTNRLDSSNGKFSVTSHEVTILIPAQKLKNKVVRLLSRVTAFLTYAPPSPTLSLLTVVQAEVLRQEQDGHDTEPNFFQGIHQVRMTAYLIPFLHCSLQHSQNSRPRPQQRHGRLKRLSLAMTRIPHSPHSPVPSTIPPPVATTTTIRTHLRHLFTRPPHHVMPLVVDVAFAKGKEVRSPDFYNRVLDV